MTHDEMIKRMNAHGYLRGVWYLVKDVVVLVGEILNEKEKR